MRDLEAMVDLPTIELLVAGYFWLEPEATQGCSQQVTVNELIGCCWRHLKIAFNATEEELDQWIDLGRRLG